MERATKPESLIYTIASTLAAIRYLERNGGTPLRHRQRLRVCDSLLPSGSGIDSGSIVDDVASRPERVVLNTSFHHMNDSGYYDGWTEHRVTVTPSLTSGFDVAISGRNRNDIKDYLADVFAESLRAEYVWTWDEEREEYAAQLAPVAAPARVA